jgi:phage repressor protein C with HTH and peptisase S24 domain
MRDARNMEWLGEELARLGRSQAELAEVLGFPDASYVNKIIRGKRRVQASEMSTITAWLDSHLTNEDLLSQAEFPGASEASDVRSDLPQIITVPEYDVRLSAGGGFIVDRETTRRSWPLPRWLVVDQLNVSPQHITLQEIIGDSMAPTLESGDFVLIDLTDRRIGLPGIFAVWDGDALVCKRIERIPGTEPAEVRIRSDNPLHGEYKVLADRVNVVGRVRWFTRRM